MTVSWFDDTGRGDCRLPQAWRWFYQKDDGGWLPVEGSPAFAIRKGAPVKVSFNPVTTRALRMEIDLAENFSAGLYEWEVEAQ